MGRKIKTPIKIIPPNERFNGECWSCNKKKHLMFMDHSVDGYLCGACTPDAIMVELALTNTDGIRNPKPGEISETDNH
tara:strand:+ start:78 stop:311 length:234 start_codon:yes stop_codon:yes gene_type:complete